MGKLKLTPPKIPHEEDVRVVEGTAVAKGGRILHFKKYSVTSKSLAVKCYCSKMM